MKLTKQQEIDLSMWLNIQCKRVTEKYPHSDIKSRVLFDFCQFVNRHFEELKLWNLEAEQFFYKWWENESGFENYGQQIGYGEYR